MRRSREDKAHTRRRTVTAAARLFRERLGAVAEECPVAALCSDVGREGRPTRAAFREACPTSRR